MAFRECEIGVSPKRTRDESVCVWVYEKLSWTTV